MRAVTITICGVILLFILLGCSSTCSKGGRIQVTTWADAKEGPAAKKGNTPGAGKAKKTVTVDITQPDNPKDEASLTFNGIKATVGGSKGIDQVIAQTKPVTWAGVACFIIGGIILGFKKFIPLVPLSTGFMFLALGAGLIAFPIFLDRYFGWFLLAGIVVALIVGGYYAYKSNWFDRETSAEMQQKLMAKGDIRGAGALATIQKNAPMAHKSTATSASQIVLQAKQFKPPPVTFNK
jgi:hypothetical protein